MPDILTIPKKSSFPPYLDFSQLRAAGIRHIENLGSDLWTDYNVHDPGITILEALCFALTDLGYRTNFDFKDLLTRSSQAKNEEGKTIFQLPFDDNFFTAAEVLSCNPVTINDLRKLLIDIPGVKNAWFQKAPEGEYPLFLNRKEKTLQFNLPFPQEDQGDRLLLRGLYDVCVELDDLLVTDACGRTFFSRNDILEKVYAVLQAHRNLCEDIREVVVLGDEQIAVCAEIELKSNADPEDVLLEIYKRVEEFLSPTLRFYTLQEILAKGVPVEDIFAGRPLTATSHGFIDLNEFKKLEMKPNLHVSDIYQVIMDIPGIAAVRNLVLANYIDDIAFTKGEKWCLPLKPYYRPHFDLVKSQITFFKGVLPFNAQKKEVEKRYNEEKAAKKKAYLDPYQLDLPIPEGTYRNIEEYTSILEEFPLTYGVGRAGIKQTPTPIRQGQAKQMKGYLLFFDQLLANYLAQLTHIRDLFSIRPDGSPKWKGKNHTYFTHILKEVPGIEELVKNFYECSANDADAPPPEDYPSYLRYIAESLETYQERRNRFLDHLLARFSESFTDYVLLSYKLDGEKLDPSRILQDKADFLNNYPEISRNRGKGMDYTATLVWDTDNISGLEKRVSKLIGIDHATRHTLGHTRLVETEAGWGAEIRDKEDNGKVVMMSKSVWPNEQAACDAVAQWKDFIGSEQHYRRLTFDVAGELEYGIQIVNADKTPLAISLHRFPSVGRYCEAVKQYVDYATHSDSLLKGFESKIELNEKTNNFYFVITDKNSAEVFRSVQEYSSTDKSSLLNHHLSSVLDNLKNSNYYCRLDFHILHNNEYGFLLLDSGGNVIAESTERYLQSAYRDEAIHGLINSVKLAGLTCSPKRETNCFYFELYDYLGQKRLFVSAEGFDSEQKAKNFFDETNTTEDFKGWAIQLNHYEKTEKEGRFSFRLKDKDIAALAGNVKAVHPQDYGTAQERDDRLQAIIYYLDEVPPTMQMEEEKAGDFQFDITDASGTVLLNSILHYATQLEAENAAWKTRIQARHRVYYKPNTTAPYSFTILDRHGNEIAYHPNSYNTECERDLAIDTLLYGSQNIDVKHRVEEQPDGFHYVLLNPEDDALMTSLTGYADVPLSETVWLDFLNWAEQKNHYHLTEEAGAEYPFGFDLWNDVGQPVAYSNKKYATEAEAKMAIQAIRNYICHTEWTTLITGEPGIYWFNLIGVGGRVLLRSAVSYPDEPSARLAYQAALLMAGDKNRYFNLPGFGFDLRDADGKIIALHPQQYENDNERDAAKNLIISYVRTDSPSYKTPNTGGAFYTIVLGPEDMPAFTGTTIYPNQETAQTEAKKLLILATDRNNYCAHSDSYTACRFGFYLTDDTKAKAIVAKHPKTYPDAASRDKAMLNVFSWLTNGAALVDEVIQGKPDFRFALKNKAGYQVLVSASQFDTTQDAENAFPSFLENARMYDRYEKFTDSKTGKLGFRLKNEKNVVIAHHKIWYLTEDTREEAIREIILFVTLRGAPYRIFEETGTWKYALQNAAGNDMLLDSIGTPDKFTAAENLKQAFVWAQANHRYLPLDNEGTCTFGFALSDTNNTEIALHPDTYGSEDLRNTTIGTFINYLIQLTIAPDVPEVPGTFYFQLTDFTDKILLKSKKDDYPTTAATKIAWNQLVQAVNDPANFQVIYDNAHCLYSVGVLVNGQILACPSYNFINRTAAYEWIDTLVLLLKKQPEATEISGTTCGYYYVVEHTEGGVTTKLLGARRYPTPADAQGACHKMAVWLRSENTFKIEQTGDKWFLVVHDESGQVVAKSEEPPFESGASAKIVYDKIVQKLSQTVEILCHAVFREHEYRCSLFDYYFVFEYPDKEGSIHFVGTHRYMDPAAARQAGNGMADLQAPERTVKVEQKGSKWQLAVYDKSEQQVASSQELFDSKENAQIVSDRIVKALAYTSGINTPKKQYRCEVFEGQIILQRVPGKSCIRFAKIDRSWSSRAVRDAVVDYFQNPENLVITDLTAKDGTVHVVLNVGVFNRSVNDKNAEKIEEFKFVSDQTFNAGDDEDKKKIQAYIDAWKAAARIPKSYRMIDDETNCRHSFEIIETSAKETACQDCNQLLELAQQQERYSLISNEEECLFGFELTDPEGIPIANSPKFYATEAERDAAISGIIQLVNSEGMHLVEHLLLRPHKKAIEPRYTVEITDKDDKLKAVDSFDSTTAAEKAFSTIMASILRAQNGEPELIRTVQENPTVPTPPDTNSSCWLIEILDQVPTAVNPNPKVLARSEGFCIDGILNYAEALEKMAGKVEELVSNIIVNNPQPSIQPLPRLYDDLEQDDLLPLIGDCADPSKQLSADLSDPYSFRATVVLPYWPARFQRSEFRSFIETTLRQEAPAHVFLRICWVDACQMREFEAAYRRWLNSKAEGELSCDSSAALNALIDIMFRLRNIYPAGNLYDCAAPPSNSNQIVLNYSIIGSANSK